MKTFKIENTVANKSWILENLDDRDFTIAEGAIIINYFDENQKSDILNAIDKSKATIERRNVDVISGKVFVWFDYENQTISGKILATNERLITPSMLDEECNAQTRASLAEMKKEINHVISY
jgi:hypothetical protein